jgi:hypothetical protein
MELPGEVFYGIGALLLLLGLMWGVYQSKTRNRRNDKITEEAVRQRRRHPETYDRKREELKKKVEPS